MFDKPFIAELGEVPVDRRGGEVQSHGKLRSSDSGVLTNHARQPGLSVLYLPTYPLSRSSPPPVGWSIGLFPELCEAWGELVDRFLVRFSQLGLRRTWHDVLDVRLPRRLRALTGLVFGVD